MKKVFSKNKINLGYILPILLIALLIAFPRDSIDGAKRGINIVFNSLLPSLLPFFVCSRLLINMGFAEEIGKFYAPVMRKIFNTPGAGSFAFFMGSLSGYPLGAKIASDMYDNGLCTKTEAERLLTFCNNSGPVFVIGVVGISMLNSQACGMFLYLIHIIASVSTGIIFSRYKASYPQGLNYTQNHALKRQKKYNLGEIVSESVKSSVLTMAEIGGYIIFFSSTISLLEKTGFIHMLSKVLLTFGVSPSAAPGMAQGLFEISRGIEVLSKSNASPEYISFILSFSGISVILQVSGIIKSKLSLKAFIAGKLIHAAFAMLYAKAAIHLMQSVFYIKTFSQYSGTVSDKLQTPWLTSLLMLFTALLVFTVGAAALKRSKTTPNI